MSRPDSFQSIWPPVGNDPFDGLPEVREARKMFLAQMTCLGEMNHQAMQPNSGDETRYLSREIAALLHNISGTAAYFGEADFGDFASGMEQPVRAAFTADLLRPLCATILDRMAPPGRC